MNIKSLETNYNSKKIMITMKLKQYLEKKNRFKLVKSVWNYLKI